MEKKKKVSKEHGIISIVQSADKSENKNKLVPVKELDKQKEHGIISIVQSPDDGKNRENE